MDVNSKTVTVDYQLPVSNIALLAANANVVMQLGNYAVGRGVFESKVDSGRLDLHPIKRARTTLGYLAVALFGTDEERDWMREETNKSHRHVQSTENSPVKYNAFSRDLQLWVAICLYKGTYDVMHYARLADEETVKAAFADAHVFGTTLQVPQEMWPKTFADYEAYFAAEMKKLHFDADTKKYLLDIVDVKFLHPVMQKLTQPLFRFYSTGFLPQPYRDALELPWNRRQQKRFERSLIFLGKIDRALPRSISEFPFNILLWDCRRRKRKGLSFV